VEDGFNIYTFQGGLACQVKREKLFQFSWRPRPKELVTSEMKKKVMKKLPYYVKIFDNDDKKRKTVRFRYVFLISLIRGPSVFVDLCEYSILLGIFINIYLTLQLFFITTQYHEYIDCDCWPSSTLCLKVFERVGAHARG